MLSFPDHNDVSAGKVSAGQIQKRPFAQLIGRDQSGSQGLVLALTFAASADAVFLALCVLPAGSSSPVGEDSVVQWEHKGGEASSYQMSYSKGRLQVQTEGHYYLYSKLTLNAAEECSLVQHKVMKVTKAYGQAIELLKSKR